MVWCFNFLDWSMFERCALDFGGCACVLCYLKPSLPLWFYGRLEGMECGQMGFWFFSGTWGLGGWSITVHSLCNSMVNVHLRNIVRNAFCRVPWRLLVWDAQIHGCFNLPWRTIPQKTAEILVYRWSSDFLLQMGRVETTTWMNNVGFLVPNGYKIEQ